MDAEKSLYKKGDSPLVDLSLLAHRDRIGRDLQNSRVVGYVNDWDFPSSNHQCEFDGVRFDNIRFNSKDFRDCTFKKVVFNDCRFRESSIIGCTFFDCEFNNTTIDSYSIHDCILVGVNFLQSVIKGSMIRYSRAQSCSFTRCVLDNKLFDECLLFDVEFVASKIDFRVIIDNFGLSSKLLSMESVRLDRSYQLGNEKMMCFDKKELSQLEESLSVLESFRMQCYFSSGLKFSGPVVDNMLSVDSWIASVATLSGFSRLIGNFTEYVIREFDQNRCYLYFLLRMHYVMYRIYENAATSSYPMMGQAAVGAHHRLGSIISKYESSVIDIYQSHGKKLQFLTDGDMDIPEIKEVLDSLQACIGTFQYSIGARNSPVLLEIFNNIAAFSAIFVFINSSFGVQNDRNSVELSIHSYSRRRVMASS